MRENQRLVGRDLMLHANSERAEDVPPPQALVLLDFLIDAECVARVLVPRFQHEVDTVRLAQPFHFPHPPQFRSPGLRGEIGPDLFRAACQMGLEGLVWKRREGNEVKQRAEA
jgi:hypothetical protein